MCPVVSAQFSSAHFFSHSLARSLIHNRGATCYLNSLIQTMYMTPELRSSLYSLTPQVLGLDEDDALSDEEDSTPASRGGRSSGESGSTLNPLNLENIRGSQPARPSTPPARAPSPKDQPPPSVSQFHFFFSVSSSSRI